MCARDHRVGRPRPWPVQVCWLTLAGLLLLGGGRALADEQLGPPEHADVVVIGGGPGGLASAIEARMAGAAHVVVVEKHGDVRERQQVVVLGQGTVDHLERLGVDVHDASVFVPIRRLEVTSDEPGSDPVTYGLSDPQRRSGRAVRTGIFEILPPHPVVSIAINALEDALARAARRKGVVVHHETELVDAMLSDTGITAVVEDAAGRRAIHGDYLLAADGARSTTSARLGVTRQPRPGSRETFVWGVFRQAGAGVQYRMNSQTPGAPYATVAIGSAQGISVGLAVDPDSVPTEAQKEAFMRRWAGELGIGGPLVRPPTIFTTESGMTDQVLLGPRGAERAFVIVDAARNDSPWYGTGTQAALLDAARFGQTYRTLADPTASAWARARALARYRRGTNRASRLLQVYGKAFQDSIRGTGRPARRFLPAFVQRRLEQAPAPIQRLRQGARRLARQLRTRAIELVVNRGRLVRNDPSTVRSVPRLVRGRTR